MVVIKGAFIGQDGYIGWVYTPEQKKQLAERLQFVSMENLTKESVIANPLITKDVDFLFSTWGMPEFDEDEIKECFPKLKAIFYAAGSVQNFARPFLNCGVRIFSAWAANAIPVAEFAAAEIILANKGFFATARMDRDFNAARDVYVKYPGNYDCKVGILGAGMIGSKVIEILADRDVEVLVFDPFLPDERAKELNVRKTSLEEIFSTCQTISNHLANNSQTVGMLNKVLFEKMLPTATFINTGRGAQVVEDDLCDFLEKNPMATAVLDVTVCEPPIEGSRFYSLPNVVRTPHIAGSYGNEVHRMASYMIEEYDRYVDGKPLKYEVSEKMLLTMA